jgi:hypothetical protein
MSRPSPLLLYLYSTKNIAGCVLALAALGAFFTGFIHDFWPEIVAGAYGIGALAAPGSASFDPVAYERDMTPDEISASLAHFATSIEKLVPADVFALVQSIVTSINGILPMLAVRAASVADADAFSIRQTALHYLPETIAAYLKMPPAFRSLQPLQDGKTANVVLVEQLKVLDAKMREIAQNLAANNAQALLANGQFLRERFATQSFLTPV